MSVIVSESSTVSDRDSDAELLLCVMDKLGVGVTVDDADDAPVSKTKQIADRKSGNRKLH